MMRTTYHVCGFFLPEGAWGKPIFMANPTTGKVTHIFYPEKVAEYEDLEEGFEPPQCGSPVYIGTVTRPSWN
jgi:hypothetical protein